MAETIYLIRHGEPGPDYTGTLIGSTDAPLGKVGIEQARRLAPFIEARQPDTFFSSPMTRCRETADQALGGAADTEQKPTIRDGLREVDFGHWEAKPFKEIMEQWPEEAGKWGQLEPSFRFPGGELMGDFIERVEAETAFLEGLEAGSAAVFAHGGVIRFMLCRLLRMDYKNHILFDIGYASTTIIKIFDRGGLLAGLVNIDERGI